MQCVQLTISSRTERFFFPLGNCPQRTTTLSEKQIKARECAILEEWRKIESVPLG